jgi:exodeoxyribonuclease-3
MKIATWNVNGIRAREAQMVEWVGREAPDVVCLQEIKAKPEQVPAALCNLGGYWCYWHGAGGYSGVGLHLRKDRFPEEPAFSHPEFDHETRIVQAVVGDLVFASRWLGSYAGCWSCSMVPVARKRRRGSSVKRKKPYRS